MTVKRYTVPDFTGAQVSKHGGWCRWEDVGPLLDELEELRAEHAKLAALAAPSSDDPHAATCELRTLPGAPSIDLCTCGYTAFYRRLAKLLDWPWARCD